MQPFRESHPVSTIGTSFTNGVDDNKREERSPAKYERSNYNAQGLRNLELTAKSDVVLALNSVLNARMSVADFTNLSQSNAANFTVHSNED